MKGVPYYRCRQHELDFVVSQGFELSEDCVESILGAVQLDSRSNFLIWHCLFFSSHGSSSNSSSTKLEWDGRGSSSRNNWMAEIDRRRGTKINSGPAKTGLRLAHKNTSLGKVKTIREYKGSNCFLKWLCLIYFNIKEMYMQMVYSVVVVPACLIWRYVRFLYTIGLEKIFCWYH